MNLYLFIYLFIRVNVVNHYLTPCRFFTPVLTDEFSLESEQQVSADLQDSSSILSNFNIAVAWMVSILHLISSLSQFLFQAFVEYSKESLTTEGI